MTTKKQTEEALKRAQDLIVSGQGGSIAETLQESLLVTASSTGEVKRPTVPKITDEHREALKRLPRVFGQVQPGPEPRELTTEEAAALIEERALVDSLLTLLKSRKDVSIRETIADHLDKVAEREGVAKNAEVDEKGHYLLKQDAPVPGTGKKFQRTVPQPTPVVDSAKLLDLYEAGQISREEYLAITVTPDVARVFDEAKARKAIKKNPGLLRSIAAATKVGKPVGTIKVANDQG